MDNIDPMQVIAETEAYYYLDSGTLVGRLRSRRATHARIVAYKVFRDADWSYRDIGDVFKRTPGYIGQTLRAWDGTSDDAVEHIETAVGERMEWLSANNLIVDWEAGTITKRRGPVAAG